MYDNEDSVCGAFYDGMTYYFEKNLQGDVIAVYDEFGYLTVRYSYDAWGKVTKTYVNSPYTDFANINPFLYRGYYYDWETGLYYLQSRYYDPAYIQIEICEDNLTDGSYYKQAFNVAAQYCALLCKMFNIEVSNVIGDCEAYQRGYGSNHSDSEYWMKRHGQNMQDFRKAVEKLLCRQKEETVEEKLPYRVEVVSTPLNIRRAAGTNNEKVGCIKQGQRSKPLGVSLKAVRDGLHSTTQKGVNITCKTGLLC